MSDTNTTPKKKMPIAIKFFIAVAAIFSIIGIDHITYNLAGFGASVTLTDSTIVVAPIDTTKSITLDTAKRAIADTAKKVTVKTDAVKIN